MPLGQRLQVIRERSHLFREHLDGALADLRFDVDGRLGVGGVEAADEPGVSAVVGGEEGRQGAGPLEEEPGAGEGGRHLDAPAEVAPRRTQPEQDAEGAARVGPRNRPFGASQVDRRHAPPATTFPASG